MKRRVDAETVRALALALPEAVESAHMDHPDFRVRGKIFATLPADGASTCLKVRPEDLEALVAADPKSYRPVWGGRWLAIDLAHVSRKALAALLADAWLLTAPKKLATAFLAQRPSTRGGDLGRAERDGDGAP